jgi:ADP-ribose pyrophosphatase YjhB (NUDIX family)
MRLPFQTFRFCPQCGKPVPEPLAQPIHRCGACGFVYFFNPASAAGVFLSHPDRGLLFLRRARDPARGKLAVPGGFIDYGESAEAGLRREILEEIGVTVDALRFLCSQPNSYEYLGIAYPVVDLFFTATLPSAATPQPLDDVASLCWLHPSEVRHEELAFPSLRAAFQNLHPPSTD